MCLYVFACVFVLSSMLSEQHQWLSFATLWGYCIPNQLKLLRLHMHLEVIDECIFLKYSNRELHVYDTNDSISFKHSLLNLPGLRPVIYSAFTPLRCVVNDGKASTCSSLILNNNYIYEIFVCWSCTTILYDKLIYPLWCMINIQILVDQRVVDSLHIAKARTHHIRQYKKKPWTW